MLIYTKTDCENLSFTNESSFEDCEFQGIDFSNFDLKSCSFLDAKFTNCNFANQSFVNTSMRKVTFDRCNLIGINWCNLKCLENPKFYESKLSFSSFMALKLKKIEIIDCIVSDVDFSGADLSYGDFSRSTFENTNFDKANLMYCDLRTSKDYVFDVRSTKIKGAKFSFPYVAALLAALGAEVEL